jgi:type IV pilus assembly protein PilB
MARGPRIGEVLIQAGLIDEFQLEAALGQQQRWGGRIGRALVSCGFIEEATLVRVLAQVLRLPVADLRDKRPAPDVLELLPAELAEKYACIPLFTKREAGKTVLYLGLEDPADLGALDELAFRLGMPVRPVLVAPSDLRDAIARLYHRAPRGAAGPGGFSETPLEPGDTAPVLTPLLGEADAIEPSPLSALPPLTAPPEDPPARALLEPSPIVPEPAPAEEPLRPVATPRPEPKATGGKPRDVATRTILQALTQILIEKGVLSRDELVERVRAIAATKDGDDPQP